MSGTIYVLRSDSWHPFVKENRDLIHKIGDPDMEQDGFTDQGCWC